MKNPIRKITDKHPILRFLSNKYVMVTAFFIVWMVFLDNYSYLDHRFLDKEINELEDNKAYYQKEIEADKKNIRTLKNPHQIEKFAREEYYMKKDSEDIYIIEYESDSTR